MKPVTVLMTKINKLAVLAGKLKATKMVHIQDICLPEFNKNRSILVEYNDLVFDYLVF